MLDKIFSLYEEAMLRDPKIVLIKNKDRTYCYLVIEINKAGNKVQELKSLEEFSKSWLVSGKLFNNEFDDSFDLDKPEVRDVVGYENLFAISENGDIISKRTNRVLKQNVVNQYLAHVSRIGGRDGKNLVLKAHRLVAKAFINNLENKPQVNHIDGIKLHNHRINLEWCTPKENSVHAKNTGLLNTPKGCSAGNSKLSRNQVLEIRENKQKMTHKALALIHKVDRSRITKLINNKTYIDT